MIRPSRNLISLGACQVGACRVIVVAWLVASFVAPAPVEACPFCSAVSQTFAEETSAMDVVIFARLIKAADTEPDEDGDIERSKFLVTKVLKGNVWVKVDETVEVHYFGTPKVDKIYLLMATDPPKLMWGSPLKVGERPQEYLTAIFDLPEGTERLDFFMDYLEDEDEMLARDAYDEFAKTPYEGIVAVKESMSRDQLMAWINDPDVPVTRRRLYFTMLGVCGDERDAALIERLMGSDKKEDRTGLNAMVGSYLSLKGAAGLPVVEKLFLRNKDADYADIYAAIMAIRFHGNESEIIDREALLPGLRAVLERDDLADLVIPDLARWEDWSVIDRLARLFKEADKESNWVRVPVINYLRACPLPEAAAAIEKLKEIDPKAVERANTFFPYAQFEGEARTGDGTESSDDVVDDTLASAEEFFAKKAAEERARRSARSAYWWYLIPVVLVFALLRAVWMRQQRKSLEQQTVSH